MVVRSRQQQNNQNLAKLGVARNAGSRLWSLENPDRIAVTLIGPLEGIKSGRVSLRLGMWKTDLINASSCNCDLLLVKNVASRRPRGLSARCVT
jgi:hypothetical protein